MFDSDTENAWMRLYKLLVQGIEPFPTLIEEAQALRGSMGHSLLHWLCLEAEVSVIESAIKAGLRLDVQDDLGNTALMEAVAAGRTEVVAALVAAGASTSIVNFDGEDLADYLELYELVLPDDLLRPGPL